MTDQSNQSDQTPSKEITAEQRTRNTVVLLSVVAGAMIIVFLFTLGEVIEKQAYEKIFMLPAIGFGAFFAIRNALTMK